LKFVGDENMSPVLVSLLAKLGAGTGIFSFRRWNVLGASDEEVVRQTGARGEVLVGPDRRQIGEPIIAGTIATTGARIIWLPSEFANSKLWDQIWWMLTHWLAVLDHVSQLRPGECAYLRASGVLVKIDPSVRPKRQVRRYDSSKKLQQLRGPFERSRR